MKSALLKYGIITMVLFATACSKKDGSSPDNNNSGSNTTFTIDDKFQGSTNNGSILAIAEQSDGKILFGGLFSTYNGVQLNHFGRLNADGSVDQSFNSSNIPWDGVGVITVQPDDKILVSSYTSVSSSEKAVIRLNKDGSIDNSFTPAVLNKGLPPHFASVGRIKVLSDGKIFLCGSFYSINQQERSKICRLNSDGTVDLSFNILSTDNSGAYDVVVLPDSKLIIAIDQAMPDYSGTNHRYNVVKTDENGNIDMTFNFPVLSETGAPYQYVTSLALQDDGKIIIAGYFYEVDKQTFADVARILPTGQLDKSFTYTDGSDDDANVGVTSLVMKNENQFLIGRNFALVPHVGRYLELINSDGTFESTFKPQIGEQGVSGIVRESANSYLIAGDFTQIAGKNYSGIARIIFK